ncbi:hypothetical protein KSP39_PZI011748 [Platanthera zijinensis]|uniref:Uncharacterized protein n=1 Tax=Platanthera zijinensis TaxID=2320716 RepID=A0AAP0BE93_9ASPA
MAVLTSIPAYVMSCFRLPKSLIAEINSILAGFWWVGNNERRCLQWKSWSFLCRPKSLGGMGFRCLASFNSTLLAKQAWRLVSRPDSLVAVVFRARSLSLCWSSIFSSRETISRGSRISVGSGSSIRIWTDHWLLRPSSFRVLAPRPARMTPKFVSDLLLPSGRGWDADLISSLFPLVDVALILSIPLGRGSLGDRWVWHYSISGLFLVRSAYHLIHLSDGPSASGGPLGWNFIWKAVVPPHIRVFL